LSQGCVIDCKTQRERVKGGALVPRRLLCVSLRSSWSPASAICQMSSTVSSASLLQHFWDPCTNSLEYTAWSSAWSSCWLRTI